MFLEHPSEPLVLLPVPATGAASEVFTASRWDERSGLGGRVRSRRPSVNSWRSHHAKDPGTGRLFLDLSICFWPC